METVIRALVAAAKINKGKALQVLFAAIGVLTVALEALKAVARTIAGTE